LVIDATFFNFSTSTFLHLLVKGMIAKAFYRAEYWLNEFGTLPLHTFHFQSCISGS